MTQASIASSFSETTAALQSWAHSVVPVGTDRFETMALFSLACYLVFAVVALQYALKNWAIKVILASIGCGSLASLLLHLSMLYAPAYVGDGPLWKFVSLTRYFPWAILILGCVYVLYRIFELLRK